MNGSESKVISLETLFLTYHSRLVTYARRFVAVDAEAEDLVQESFISYWNHYCPCEGKEASRLLFTITRNRCLDYLKKQRPEFISALKADDPVGEELLYNWDFCQDSPEEQMRLLDELQNQVNVVLDSLPSRCRKVFEMSRLMGMTNREIAEALQISHTAVEKHIRRALAAFDRSLRENPSILFVLFVLSVTGHIHN